MKNKVIIGSVILISAAAAAYSLVKKSHSQAVATANSSSGTLPVPNSSASPGTQRNYPAGTLLTDSTEYIFIIDDQGYRHWIPNWDVFRRMGLSRADVKSISIAEMQSIPRLSDLAGFNRN